MDKVFLGFLLYGNNVCIHIMGFGLVCCGVFNLGNLTFRVHCDGTSDNRRRSDRHEGEVKCTEVQRMNLDRASF